MSQTQLLCTFTRDDSLQETLEQIKKCYSIVYDNIYVLENIEDPTSLYCTYNIDRTKPVGAVPPSTISLHRKKNTNTLYTINALNKLVAESNGGKIDKEYQIDWENYRNTIIVTQYGHLKQIKTRIREIHKLNEE